MGGTGGAWVPKRLTIISLQCRVLHKLVNTMPGGWGLGGNHTGGQGLGGSGGGGLGRGIGGGGLLGQQNKTLGGG